MAVAGQVEGDDLLLPGDLALQRFVNGHLDGRLALYRASAWWPVRLLTGSAGESVGAVQTAR